METQSLLIKFTVVLALFFGLIGMTNLNAQEFTVGDLNYRVNSDWVSVTLTGHVNGQNAAGELIIPASVHYAGDDFAVTRISNQAFYNCSGLTGSLTIPNSVTEIGSETFYNCYGFTGSLILPSSITYIGERVFYECSGFTSLHIPNSVTGIGYMAFYNCYGFAGTLTIPNSVIGIQNFAFLNCHGFDGTLIIPNSLIYIGNGAFAGIFNLDEIIVEPENSAYDSRDNCNAIINTSDNILVTGCKNTIIPNSVTGIGNQAFYNCTGLTGSLTLPNTVTSIGIQAFYNCTGLTGSLTLPNSITSIGDYAFYNCTGLTGSLTLPNTITRIGDYTFYNCYGFTGSLRIPNPVSSIGKYAFYNCYGFNGTLTIGFSVASIGYSAFDHCSNFTTAVSYANTPPTLIYDYEHYTVFANFGTETIAVPYGCTHMYENSSWRYEFSTIIEDCSDVTELDENLASVYPNPTTSIVKIEAENIQNISIYNMLGEMVFDSKANGNEFEYDFSNNESGVYIVRVETARGVVTKRITAM